jgi:hypothetical protein
MSEQSRTKQEFIEMYAKTYCNGDTEEAMKHAIVREVMREKECEQNG